MRIGVTVPNVHDTLAEPTTIEAVGRMADDLGLDSVWCNDHLAMPAASGDAGAEPAYTAGYGEDRGQRIYEPLIVLAYLAAVTRRVMLGTSVYLAPAPQSGAGSSAGRLARRLSGGRLVLGVGIGWLESEFAALGGAVAGARPPDGRGDRGAQGVVRSRWRRVPPQAGPATAPAAVGRRAQRRRRATRRTSRRRVASVASHRRGAAPADPRAARGV